VESRTPTTCSHSRVPHSQPQGPPAAIDLQRARTMPDRLFSRTHMQPDRRAATLETVDLARGACPVSAEYQKSTVLPALGPRYL
jgi:hypothetical protein